VDVTGTLLCGAVLQYFGVPFLTMLWGQRNNPFYLLMSSVLLEKGQSNILVEVTLLGISAVLLFIFAFEVCRHTVGFFVFFVIGLNMFNSSLELLYQLNPSDLTKCSEHYTRLMIIKLAAHKGLARSSFCLLASAVFFGVVCNYVAILMHDMLPFFLYVVFPALSVLVLVWTRAVLRQTVKCFTLSSSLLNYWKSQLKDLKYRSRKLNSMRIIALSAGVGDFDFFMLETSTTIDYQRLTIDQSLNAVMSFPIQKG